MKNAVIGFTLLVILIFGAIAINTVGTQKIRQNELDANLGRSLKKSLEIFKVDKTYQMSEDELSADVAQNIMEGKAEGSSFQVKIYQLDQEAGVLDIEATETFNQVIGKGTVKARKKLLFEQWKGNQDVFYTVKFREGEDTVKEVTCKAQEHLTGDILPKTAEGVSGWELVSPSAGNIYTPDNIADVAVITNLVFEARR